LRDVLHRDVPACAGHGSYWIDGAPPAASVAAHGVGRWKKT
jgi:hypothetical protein